jgi:hypothetical protein
MTEEMRAKLPAEQIELMNNAPSWGIYIYAIGVFGGVAASILLLMRKKLAVGLFGYSLLAILILQLYWVFAMDIVEVMGPKSLIMPTIVIAVAIFEYFYSKGASRNGWIL